LSIVEHEPPGLRAPFLTAMARRFRARLSGDGAIAEYEFKAAAAQLRELELPFYCAVVQLEYGKWLAAQGRDEAAELRSDARDTFERLEAAPWIRRVDAVAAPARPGSPAVRACENPVRGFLCGP